MALQSHTWAYIQRKTWSKSITCTPIFISALFTIGNTWKKPKCPSTEEWIKKMCYTYTMEYYSTIKKNEIMPICSNMHVSNPCDAMDCSPPGSSVHGIFQAIILEWVVISYSRGSSWFRDQTCLSWIGRWLLYHFATWETPVKKPAAAAAVILKDISYEENLWPNSQKNGTLILISQWLGQKLGSSGRELRLW